MTILLPPRYVTTPARVIYSKESSALKDTFNRLLGLAWRHDYQRTDDLLVDELIEFLCLARRTYYLHVEKLIEMSWLLSMTPRAGFVRFTFPIMQAAGEVSAKSCTGVQKVAQQEDEEDEDSSLRIPPHHPPLTPPAVQKVAQPERVSQIDGQLALLQAIGVRPDYIARIYENGQFSLEDILAETAYCYDPRNTIRKPETIVALNLIASHRAPATYYGQVHHIPAAILERAGLGHLIPGDAVVEPQRETPRRGVSTDGDDDQEDLPPLDPSLTCLAFSTTTTPAKAWESALGQFRETMSKATFDTWVRDARPLRYDHEQGVLTIGVRNPYARDWLDERLKSTAIRLLTGLLNRTVEVRFEVV